MSQLLGQDGENVKLFVEDVGKFQGGESLSAVASRAQGTMNNTADESVPGRQRQENYMDGAKGNDKPQERQTHLNSRKPAPKPAVTATKRQTPPPPKPSVSATKKPVPPVAANQTPPVSIQHNLDKKIQPETLKSPPHMGVASRVCGCYGTRHKPLTNCLYCGRISCTHEGYDFCGFCGFLVSPPQSSSSAGGGSTTNNTGKMSESWLLKERLLRFDREFARRTEVVDDQEDYYANTTSTWLTEEEKHDAIDKVDDRQQKLNPSGKKQVLNLQF